MIDDVFVTLTERLRMADDGLDVINIRAGYAEQGLINRKLHHSVNIKRTGEHKVCHLTNLAVIAVFYRKNA